MTLGNAAISKGGKHFVSYSSGKLSGLRAVLWYFEPKTQLLRFTSDLHSCKDGDGMENILFNWLSVFLKTPA